ncbi:DUF1800 domain-containing protein [Kineosporia sp. NBRC 101731]|uniref:DUF1800 domain-containing protein n=1 Tax=Kineosporia sp. NBRC 101731 TaxID=3032199 RepID=UPI0024A5BFCB|nr:DUF1800 domain-containing protein [Kineosporia sp. NBRC 101731]GLY28925.1 hypothetical protein Kisp02_22900 [Kineosporia sp. NBRC 101731]
MPELPPPPAPDRRSRRVAAESSHDAGRLSRRTLVAAGGTGVAAATATAAFLLKPSGGTATAAPTTGPVTLTAAQRTANAAEAADVARAAKATATESTTGSAAEGTGSTATTSSSSTTAAAATYSMNRDLDPALLLSRATYGHTTASAAELRRLGPKKWLEWQLQPAKISDPGVKVLGQYWPQLSRTISQVKAATDGKDYWMPLMGDHIGRAIFSRRQLFEVMVDFWSNHLNVFPSDAPGGTYETRHAYQRDVIRRHALGDFESMLLASAFHPTMLAYLNGNGSTGQEPNENYAREILELHTVGVDAGYTERDVRRGALLLTGWKLDDQLRATYLPANHYVGKLRVFGFTTANATAASGKAAQRAYVKYLARHPKTAQHIARKLAVRFVSDNPPASLVKKLAAAYTKNDTKIAPVLRMLFSSKEFSVSKGKKLRRPMEQLVATARALDLKPATDPIGLLDLVQISRQAGHGPVSWPQPNGYDDSAASYQSPAAALIIFNATSAWLVGGGARLKNPGFVGFLKNPPTNRTAAVTATARKLLGRNPTTAERKAVTTLLNSATLGGQKLPTTFTAGSQQQRETIYLTAMLLLSSPAHLTR